MKIHALIKIKRFEINVVDFVKYILPSVINKNYSLVIYFFRHFNPSKNYFELQFYIQINDARPFISQSLN